MQKTVEAQDRAEEGGEEVEKQKFRFRRVSSSLETERGSMVEVVGWLVSSLWMHSFRIVA